MHKLRALRSTVRRNRNKNVDIVFKRKKARYSYYSFSDIKKIFKHCLQYNGIALNPSYRHYFYI